VHTIAAVPDRPGTVSWRDPVDGPQRDPALYSAPPQRPCRRRTSLAFPTSGSPDRGTRTPTRFEAAGTLILILALGLAFRLLIAYVLLPGSGFGTDRDSFQAWAGDLAANGPGGFYGRVSFIDYTPGYLYVLWLVGVVGQALGGIGDLIKLPAIVADVVLAGLVHNLVVELGGSRRSARIGAILVLVNPVTWFDSAVWGQVDAFGVIFLLLSVRDLWRRRPERASILAVAAAVIKPQLGILIPILAFVLLRRHVWERLRRSSPEADPAAGPEAAEPAPERPTGPHGEPWLDRFGQGPIRLVSSGVAGLLTAVILCLPFGLSIIGLIQQVIKTAGGYPYITVNAYNPWAWVTHDGNGLAANGLWLRDSAGAKADEIATLIGGIPAVIIGTALLLGVIFIVASIVAWSARPATLVVDEDVPAGPIRLALDDRRVLIVALTVMAIAFFVVPTRVHERYLFPFVILGAILAATSVRWRVAYVVLSVASFANLYAVLLTPFYKNPGVKDWLGLADAIRTPIGVTLIAAVHLAAFAWALTELRAGALRRLDREAVREAHWEVADALGDADGAELDDASADVDDAADPAARDEGRWAPGPVSPAATPVGGASWSAAAPRPPEPSGLPLPFGLGSIRALLPDRSRRLHGEGSGRFDRLDLWLLAVIVIVALVSRTFRLAEPYRMHFDEVYHARTAAEFLQDWRYGQPHDIYEWTHPHLAKYAMAAGLVVAGDDRVTAQRSLGTAVRDVAVEPRWDNATLPDGRAGDRFYVVGGDALTVYDLATRVQLGQWSVPGAAVLAVDPVGHRVLIGTDGGQVLALETTELDGLRTQSGAGAGSASGLDGPAPLATVGGAVHRMALTDDASGLAVALADSEVVLVDPGTGAERARVRLNGVADLADGGFRQGLTVDPAAVKDPAAAAAALAKLTAGKASDYQALVKPSAGSGSEPVVVLADVPDDVATAIAAAISDGRLAGFSLAPLPLIAASDATGLAFISPSTGQIVESLDLGAAGRGMAAVTGVDKPTLYVALADRKVAVVTVAESDGKARPIVTTSFWMPGDVSRVLFDEPTTMVHVLGSTPDGSSQTIYVIEPHANAVYADARLPFSAAAWAIDTDAGHPSDDRQAILATAADGTLGSVDIGKHAFAWRLPGVLAGALTAGLIFLLVRMLFRRREIAILAAVLVLVDGMMFVQARIGMNDVYVGLFIVAAYTLFAGIWTGRWRSRWAFWVVLPVLGVVLGLGLASKWVALYAMAGIAVLILARSALGRILLILGFAAATTVLGYMALNIPADAKASGPSYLFMGLMIAITLATTIVTVLHPIAWSIEETRLALVGPAAIGILVFLAAVPLGVATKAYPIGPTALTPVEIALLLILASGGVWLLLRLAALWGLGPLAPPPDADDPVRLTEPGSPPPEGWLRPGAMLGLPIVWAVICLGAIPIAVYLVSYLPWAALGNRITDTWPPGHTGQTLADLTRQMYDYHNGLRATHAASSPYWAWPFDLKPVWFYQDGFSGGTSGAIYDAGNLIAWWLAIPAMLFVVWQAFKRRSLGLALIFVAFGFQWMTWSRIDRATFQYHYYAAVPFLLIALAYFLAELRNGPSARTWALARLSAALAVFGPALMYLFKGPLCGFVRVIAVNPGSQACVATAPGQIVLTWRAAGLASVLVTAGIALIVQVLRIGSRGRSPGGADRQLLGIGLTAAAGIVGLLIAGQVLPDAAIISQDGFMIEPIALVVLIALAPVAWVVATARDARRFVAGIVLACLTWFAVWYPNLSGLPLPSSIVNAYQGLLPTYLYAFQFPVNTDKVVSGVSLMAPISKWIPLPVGPTLLGVLLLTCLIVGYSAWTWRISLAEGAAAERDRDAISRTGQLG
jgi:4-amino-4-deoxy-L-arabinose transferase-like glycosyltransferase